MEQINTWLFNARDWLTALVSVITAVAAIYGWVIKPIKAQQAKQQEMVRRQEELDHEQTRKIDEVMQMLRSLSDRVDRNQAEYIRDRLQTLREHYCHEIGWATAEEKRRIIEWYESYRARGFNHLAETYVKDIESLPEAPRT